MSASRGAGLPVRYDDVLIGSSPLMLFKALERAIDGRKVLVVERAEVLGGAWYSPSMLGFACVEAGVHLIENRELVHRRLEAVGVELCEEGEAAIGIWGSIRMPLALARAISFFGVLLRAALAGDRDAVATTLPRALRSLGSLSIAFRYPRGGAGEMVRALVRRLDELGVVLMTSCRIEEVILRPDAPGGECKTSAGIVEFDSFCFSSRAHCPIRIGDELLERRAKSRETLTLLVRMKGHQVSEFGYVEILADELLRRVRDVTSFVVPRVPDRVRILCIQLRESMWDEGASLQENARRAVDRLAEVGLVARSAEIVSVELDRFVYHTLSDRDLVSLTSRHRSLDAIRTTDFAEDMFLPRLGGPRDHEAEAR